MLLFSHPVSECGSYNPQSCLFSQMCNICSVLASVVKSIHLLGAFLAFFLGLAYFWVQLLLTYRAGPSQDRCWVGPWALVMLFFGLFGLFAAEFRHIDCHQLTIQKPSLGNASVVVNTLLENMTRTHEKWRRDPRSQTRNEPVSRSLGPRPTISPRTMALALGVSPLARDGTE
ncbi:hypothetical protein F7725_003777 [Dissostichus mawsoni]|uniref:Uncharacterized protein n=1 Tax=Dissostichus mawsoni TaxID=36200 RepID=A0A7J5YD45_DISMA|nr:hypothetical protein F7725_003777 [Dissostichus mawsoni]